MTGTPTWTRVSPNEEGHYWYYSPEYELIDTVRVFKSSHSEELLASGSMFDNRRTSTMEGKWAGPLTPPDLEEDEDE